MFSLNRMVFVVLQLATMVIACNQWDTCISNVTIMARHVRWSGEAAVCQYSCLLAACGGMAHATRATSRRRAVKLPAPLGMRTAAVGVLLHTPHHRATTVSRQVDRWQTAAGRLLAWRARTVHGRRFITCGSGTTSRVLCHELAQQWVGYVPCCVKQASSRSHQSAAVGRREMAHQRCSEGQQLSVRSSSVQPRSHCRVIGAQGVVSLSASE